MGAKATKEDKNARVLMKERDAAITRQRYYELFELRQDWNFVFGEEVPKQKKDVLIIKDMTPRDVWMEDMYLFKQILACRPNELFHSQSEYALKWTPPGSNFKLMVPFDNPAMQEAVIIQLSRIPKPIRKKILFHFAPRDPNQTMFREAVHPASLVSYHHKNEVLQKLCVQFLEARMDIVEFNNTIGSTYDVWKRAMYNMLPEDEQVYHTYLTEMPEAEPSIKLLDNEYLEGRITLQEYEDLKFPERKKRRDAEALKYPLPHSCGLCIICNEPEKGIIKCNVCDNRVCIDCILKKFHRAETREGSFLLIHRRFCLKLALLKPVHVEVQMPPAYLRELRMTGLAAALELLKEQTKPPPEEELLEAEDEEDEEERRYREQMQRIKEEREYNAMMKENPPALQHCIRTWDNKIEKKLSKVRKEAMELQVRIDEPGHSDFFVERLVRLKQECVEKLPEVAITPGTPLLEKAIELDLQESSTCKAFIEKLTAALKECHAMMEMTSMQHFEDIMSGVTVEERQAIVAEQHAKALEMRAERDAAAAELKRTSEGVQPADAAMEDKSQQGTVHNSDAAVASASDEPAANHDDGGRRDSHRAHQHKHSKHSAGGEDKDATAGADGNVEGEGAGKVKGEHKKKEHKHRSKSHHHHDDAKDKHKDEGQGDKEGEGDKEANEHVDQRDVGGDPGGGGEGEARK